MTREKIATVVVAWVIGMILTVGIAQCATWVLINMRILFKKHVLNKKSDERADNGTYSAANNRIYYLGSVLASLICYILSSVLCVIF